LFRHLTRAERGERKVRRSEEEEGEVEEEERGGKYRQGEKKKLSRGKEI